MNADGLVRSSALDREALASEVRSRRARLNAVMEAQGLDAIVVASEANVSYLTGYETTFFGNLSKPFAVVYTGSETTAVCHVGEEPSIRLDAIDTTVAPYFGPSPLELQGAVQLDYQLGAADAILQALGTARSGHVGLELSWHFIPGLTPLAMDRLRDGLVDRGADASVALWSLRRRKSVWELEQMRAAATAAAYAHAEVAAAVEIGMSEKDINRLLRRAAYHHGAEKIGYSGVIAGVDRAPLGGPTDRRLEHGQLLFVDLCLQLNGGYFADFNRILSAGEPTDAQRRAYASVVDGLDRAKEILRAGTSVGDLAQVMIGDAPTIYARVGHGLGLEMPEPPSLSPADPGPLADGEVVCLEPNTFADGVGWLVSEEEVVVREDGFELLSPPFPREIETIGV